MIIRLLSLFSAIIFSVGAFANDTVKQRLSEILLEEIKSKELKHENVELSDSDILCLTETLYENLLDDQKVFFQLLVEQVDADLDMDLDKAEAYVSENYITDRSQRELEAHLRSIKQLVSSECNIYLNE